MSKGVLKRIAHNPALSFLCAKSLQNKLAPCVCCNSNRENIEMVDSRRFPQIKELSDDLVVTILSFVADVPLELPENKYSSSLTHIFPVVSKHFYAICESSADYFYKSALERLVDKEPALWLRGLRKLLGPNQPSPHMATSLLVEHAFRSLDFQITYRDLFRKVMETLRYVGHLFHMPDTVFLGQPIGLHFFEPRYRLLIAEVMSNYPESARQGQPIHEVLAASNGDITDYPTFVYGHTSPLTRGSPGVLVHVVQCLIHPDGTADVHLLPVQYAWIEHVWERPNSGRMLMVRCLKMNKEAAQQVDGRTRY